MFSRQHRERANNPSKVDLLNPWSPYWTSRRDTSRAGTLFEAKYLHDTSWLHAPEIAPAAHPPPVSDLFFGRLPAEIRRQILIAAFGDQTVHMDLQYRYPWSHDPDESSHTQLRVNSSGEDIVRDSGDGESKEWRWYSCVCHRAEPSGNRLTYGRRGDSPNSHFSTPRTDLCLSGLMSKCHEWPGEKPGKCFIGIAGWLLTCKQAYFESIEVLYSTNTVHIASPTLHQSIHYLLPQRRLRDLVSLELVWQPNSLSIPQAFTDYDGAATLDRPTFPSLAHLHISIGRWDPTEPNYLIGMGNIDDREELSERIHNSLLVEIDEMLPRVVPPTTDVVISCPDWKWYEAVDLFLIEKQGKERTRPQEADIGGLKCWRETPKKPGSAETASADNTTHTPRDGYWIHVSKADVKLTDARKKTVVSQTPGGMMVREGVDWDRHELYSPSQV